MTFSPPEVLRAVIFDFDGVLADTMPENFRAWQRAFREHGITLEPGAYFPLEGMGRYGIAEILCQRYALAPSLSREIAERKEQFYLSGNQLRLYPGVPELLHELRRADIRLALVTGASRERLDRSLQEEIRSVFFAVVTSDDVKATKPDPQPYVKALASLGEPAGHCVAIENAPLGITAAKGAGLFCIALCTTLGADMLPGADVILQTHADLSHFFSRYTVRAKSEKPG